MKKIIKKFYFLLLKYINPKVDKNTDKLTHYGTKYGGYDIVDNQKIFNVISCGLGEDASFDIEIINAKNCKVIAVDPTPRAATHFKTIMENVGNSRKTDYSNDGFQENSAYNLEKINKRNYKLIDSAVFDKSKKQIKLFFPKNENHVSASLDLTNKYSENFAAISCSTAVLTSEDTSLSLVCELNLGSGTLTEIIAVRPSRASSPVALTFSFLPIPSDSI